jgi:photosystem II stability/assembly factor-like uncharacterized protein
MRLLLMLFGCWFGIVGSAFSQSWTLTGAPNDEDWQAMSASADGNQLLAVGETDAYVSTNSGVAWTEANLNVGYAPWRAVASSANGGILAAGGYGALYFSTNSGASWFLNTNAPQNVWYGAIAFSADGSKMVAAPYGDLTAGNPQPLYLSGDSGKTWQAALLPSNNWNAVASSADGTKLMAFAFNGPIYRSTNSGASWNTNNLVEYWRSVTCSADGTKAVAAAYPGQIYTSTNSGANWISHTIAGSRIGFGSVASSADGTRLLAVGFQSSAPIFVSTNSGNSWAAQTTAPAVADWGAVASSADGRKIFAATYGYTANDNAGGIYILQTIPSPPLKSTLVGTNLIISWPVPSTNFVLQQNMDLTTSDWLTMTNTPLLNLTNLQYEIGLLPTNGAAFYRLATGGAN